MSRTRSLRPVRPLDLTPIMGLVAILIPLLLMAYRPAELALIDTSLPAICATGCDRVEGEPRIVTPSLAITAQGFVVGGLAEVPDLETDEAGRVHLPCTSGACAGSETYDTQALTALLGAVKDAYPDSTSITLVPDGRVPYEVVVRAMDASRAAPAPGTGQAARELFPYPTVAGGTD